jgi:hypothetical protein
MRAGWYFVAILTLLVVSGGMREARAASPGEYCQKIGTDDALRVIPTSLVPDAVRLFQLDAMPAKQVQQSTYFRCANHHVRVCNVGANLPCGKADTRRHLPGANDWCASHAGSDFIPMYVIGHTRIGSPMQAKVPPPDPLPPPELRKADLKQLMEAINAVSTEPLPAFDLAERAEAERQRHFDNADRYETIMATAGSVIAGAVATVLIMWQFSASFFGALVIGLLWSGLIYAVCGWEREKRRNQRVDH